MSVQYLHLNLLERGQETQDRSYQNHVAEQSIITVYVKVLDNFLRYHRIVLSVMRSHLSHSLERPQTMTLTITHFNKIKLF